MTQSPSILLQGWSASPVLLTIEGLHKLSFQLCIYIFYLFFLPNCIIFLILDIIDHMQIQVIEPFKKREIFIFLNTSVDNSQWLGLFKVLCLGILPHPLTPLLVSPAWGLQIWHILYIELNENIPNGFPACHLVRLGFVHFLFSTSNCNTISYIEL